VFLGALEGPAKEATQVVARSGLTILESSILGAITLVALGVAAVCVWKLSKVQDQRAADMSKANERMEQLVTKMTVVFAEFNNSLNNLARAEEQGQAALATLKQSVDTVVYEAVRGGRRYSPPQGQQRPPGSGGGY
jgi:uncharacterized membrane protein